MSQDLLTCCCFLLALCNALMSLTIPTICWMLFRQGQQIDLMKAAVSKLEEDVLTLDQVVDGIGRQIGQPMG